MDLTGRSPAGYRGVAIRCPGCGDPMSVVPLSEADVDVCATCQGIWVDWFDGELGAVARDVARVTHGQGPAGPTSGMRNEVVATGGCPRCPGVQLVSERYAVKHQPAAPGAKVEVQETGAELLRCEHCAGSFLSATSAALLSRLPPEENAPPSASEKVLEPLPWQKFVAVLRALFGLRSG